MEFFVLELKIIRWQSPPWLICKDISEAIKKNHVRQLVLSVGKPLGKGTFGQVKQGTHILTGEKVMYFPMNYACNCKCYTFFLTRQLYLGCCQDSGEREDSWSERCWENHSRDQNSQESQTPQRNPTIWGKLHAICNNLFTFALHRSLRLRRSCSWSWNTATAENFSTSLSEIHDSMKSRQPSSTGNSSQVLNTSIRVVSAIGT